jgi:hypothetical protein
MQIPDEGEEIRRDQFSDRQQELGQATRREPPQHRPLRKIEAGESHAL